MEKDKVKLLGSLYGYSGANYAGTVWDKQYISPTILTAQGGGREPHIIEIIHLGKAEEIKNGNDYRWRTETPSN